jgi:hypothetical protein
MKGVFSDLAGQRFGRLTAIEAERIELSSGRKVMGWRCACDCGAKTLVHAVHLKAGRVGSCGCLNKELTARRNRTHGRTGTREHRIWKAMIRRCYNKNVREYRFYGARGIAVCDRWRSSFENFYADVGRCPEGKSLDRINNDGNYEAGNCRWATPQQQARNRRPRGGAA